MGVTLTHFYGVLFLACFGAWILIAENIVLPYYVVRNGSLGFGLSPYSDRPYWIHALIQIVWNIFFYGGFYAGYKLLSLIIRVNDPGVHEVTTGGVK